MLHKSSIWAVTVCAILAALPLVAANSATTTGKKPVTATRKAWPSETIDGTISMVSPDRKLVIIQTSSGVPFDLRVTPATRIESGSQSLKITDLQRDVTQGVSVKFVPERSGDIARSIRLGS
jgi:hypothetical protein